MQHDIIAHQLSSNKVNTLHIGIIAPHILCLWRDYAACFRYFTYLSHHGDRMKFDLAQAAAEARQCSDLLSQAAHYVSHARKIDEQEREMRMKQEEERDAMRQKQQQEQVCDHFPPADQGYLARSLFSVTAQICIASYNSTVWPQKRYFKHCVVYPVCVTELTNRDCIYHLQLAKQKHKEEQEKRLLDQRAKFIEKTKNLRLFQPFSEDKPKKSGGKVG